VLSCHCQLGDPQQQCCLFVCLTGSSAKVVGMHPTSPWPLWLCLCSHMNLLLLGTCACARTCTRTCTHTHAHMYMHPRSHMHIHMHVHKKYTQCSHTHAHACTQKHTPGAAGGRLQARDRPLMLLPLPPPPLRRACWRWAA